MGHPFPRYSQTKPKRSPEKLRLVAKLRISGMPPASRDLQHAQGRICGVQEAEGRSSVWIGRRAKRHFRAAGLLLLQLWVSHGHFEHAARCILVNLHASAHAARWTGFIRKANNYVLLRCMLQTTHRRNISISMHKYIIIYIYMFMDRRTCELQAFERKTCAMVTTRGCVLFRKTP